MESYKLISGLNFVKVNGLTKKEIEVLLFFLKKPFSVAELSKAIKINKFTLYHLVQRLILKRVIIFKEKDSSKNKIYQFNHFLLN